MKTFGRGLACILAVIFLPVAVATAQVESGVVAGTVTDQSGAVIPNASVTVKNLGTNAERNTRTSTAGAFNVNGLPPATYQVTANAAGFKSFATKVEVTVGGHVTIDAKLSVSASTVEVQVVAEGGVQVNTQTQELSQIVDQQELAQLPSLTRNPYDFVGISGNVSSGDNTTSSADSGQNLTNRGVGFAINGQRESGTEILLDGVENIAVFGEGIGEDVPVDAVQEYSVITNNYSAEFGRASGGVVNVTTKAGTNQYHASAWEFNRLAAYTANTYANDAANAAAGSIVAPKGGYTRNQFGFQGTGPIFRNKLFISETTEFTRVRSAASETEEIFDPSFIAMLPANAQAYFGKFGTGASASSGVASTAGQIVGTCFFGSSSTTACVPTPFPLINGVTPVPDAQPIFDTVNFTVPFDAGGGVPQNGYALVGRLDFNPTDKTQMFFRAARESISFFNGSSAYSAYPQYDVGTSEANQSFLYSLGHTFSNNLFANMKASFTRFNTANSFDTSLTNTPNLMFVSPTDPYTQGLIQMPGLENYSEPGEGGLPYGGPQNTIQVEPDLSLTKGRHSFRAGGLWTYLQLNVAYGAYAQAVEELGADGPDSMMDLVNSAGNPGGSQLVAFDARVNPQGQLPCYLDIYGNAINPSSCQVTPPLVSATYGRSYRYNDWAFYGQDDYKVTPRLTLNLGLRYEHYGVQHNNNAALDSNFYFGAGSGIEAQVRAGTVQIADKSSVGQFWKPRWGTFAPRVGFAYDLLGNSKTSLRGGAGISYERNFGNVTYNASFNPPASAVLSSTCSPEDPTCTTALVTNNDLGPLGVAGPATTLPPVELRMPNPNINVAQTQFWSLALADQLTRTTVVEVGYSGAHSVHLYDIENINLPGAGQVYLGDPLVTGAACANTGYANEVTGTPECLTRPTSQFSNINMRGSLGAGSYSALNLRVQSQNLHNTGLSLVANYTWSHSLDDLSSTFGDSLQGGSGYIGSLGYTSLLDPMLDWGSSDYDIRHRLAITPIWETPWFKNGTNLEHQALGGWLLSGIFSIRTGIPFSVFDYDNDENFYTVPRLTPASPITNYHVGSAHMVGPNNFTALTIPVPASFAPLNPTLGISDFGPYPTGMTGRNAFRGPGAWNADLALDKKFNLTERLGMEFRAEGFDLLNHHNYYVNTTTLAYFGPGSPLQVTELKGGLGSLATGGNHDERRFGQFALKVNF
jgi:outer membrane receptor protein involved in Fe transport